MIVSLSGTLVHKQAPSVVIEVGGIGYAVETPMSTFFDLPAVGQPISLLTHFLVREDAQQLYGFVTGDERALFQALLKVSGVGARIALAILSGVSVDGFRRCIEFEDVAALVKVPGIGRKTAERLIVEMRDRIQDLGSDRVATAPKTAGEQPAKSARSEAYNAMLSLGYKDAEVRRLLKAAEESGDCVSAEDYIRLALRQAAG